MSPYSVQLDVDSTNQVYNLYYFSRNIHCYRKLTPLDISDNSIRFKEQKLSNSSSTCFDNGLIEFKKNDDKSMLYTWFNNGKVWDTGNVYYSTNTQLVQNDLERQIIRYTQNLVAYQVSLETTGLFAIGVENGQYTFYRFAHATGTIMPEKKFPNVGLDRSVTITSITALGNGRFKIYTNKGSYTYNYFNDGGFE